MTVATTGCHLRAPLPNLIPRRVDEDNMTRSMTPAIPTLSFFVSCPPTPHHNMAALQDLFAFDSPPRPATKQRSPTPLSPASEAGPSRTVRRDASNPLFLSPTSNYGTPARKRPRDDVWVVESPAGSVRSGPPRTPLAPLPTSGVGLAQRAAAAANHEFISDPLALQDPLAGINGEDGDDEPARKRLPVAKVDADRLLAPKGFPALMKFAKKFKPRGKGHEVGGNVVGK